MIELALAVPVALWLGFYLREVKNTLAQLGTKLESLKALQEKMVEKPKMGYAEPLSMEDFEKLEEEARLEKLNQVQ